MRDSISIMRGWTPGDKATGDAMISQLTTLTKDRHAQSMGAAADYLNKHTTALGQPRLKLVLPKLLTEDITPSLYVTTFRFVGSAMARGMSLDAAKQNVLVTGSGSTGRLALSGGRETITRTTIKNGAGWARVTSPGACEFCLMLEDRGAVYGEASVDFESHDHCGCTAEPDYS